MENRKIFLLRHGHIQTKEDKKFFIGQTDCSLSIKGLEQIKKTGEFIKDIDLKHIVCSCLKRSIKSAEIIAEHHDIKVKSYQALNEINLGEWDGLSFDEVKEKYPDEFKKRGEDIVNYRVKGAENFFDLKKRVMKQFYEIINNFEGNILITAHAGVNRVILCSLMDKNLENIFAIKQDYGNINLIEQENSFSFKIIYINKTIN